MLTMADYNIYIHSVTGSDDGSNTKAWGIVQNNSQTKPWGTAQQGGESDSSDNGGGFSPKTMVKAFQKHPYATAFVAGALTTTKALDLIIPIYTSQTGNYYFSDRWETIKGTLKQLLNPIGTAINWQQQYYERKRQSQANDQNAALLGDAYVNHVVRKM